ncbi:hypothetical protein MMC31_004082 [Peltigera leucophlebia]|nr:hypothetical protein [Peltigera leucophlebia]
MAGDDRPLILGISIVFPIIAIIAVILRFEARRINRLKPGADDWTILAALILTIGVTIDVLLDSRLGNLGGHETFTPDGEPVFDRQFLIFGQTTFALELLVWPCVGLNKISVLLLYKRIFVNKGFQIMVWCSIGIVTAWTVAFTFALLFSCMPISSHWDPTIAFTCVNEISLFTAALSTDVITDGLILLLPIYNVWQLQMPLHRKIAVICIFLLGGLVTITGIIRLHFLTLAYNSLEDHLFNDVSYSYGPAFYWSIIETNVGILSACLPTLRPLYRGYRLSSISSIVSKFRSTFSGSGSRARLTDNIRLKSAENGFNDYDSKATTTPEHDPYMVNDDSNSSTQRPKVNV